MDEKLSLGSDIEHHKMLKVEKPAFAFLLARHCIVCFLILVAGEISPAFINNNMKSAAGNHTTQLREKLDPRLSMKCYDQHWIIG